MKPYTYDLSHARRPVATAAPHHLKRASWRLGLLAAACLLAGGGPGLAATKTWTNSVTDINWSAGINWSGNGAPGILDTAQFGSTGAATTPGEVNCIVNANTTIKSLYFYNTNGLLSHDIRIADGVTLSFTNTTTGYAIWSHANDAAITDTGTQLTNIISGPQGSIVINSVAYPGAYVASYAGGTDVRALLDMSDLGSFTAYLTRFYVAPTGGGTSGINRESGTVKLARTNLIYSSFIGPGGRGILIGLNNNNPAPGGTLELGQTNAIFSDTGMDVGMRRANDSRLYFNPSFVNPTAYFRNRTGGRQGVWWIGSSEEVSFNAAGGGYAQGTVDFSGGTVDALVDQIVIGRCATNLAYPTGGRGFLKLTAGTINAMNITNGDQNKDNDPSAVGQVDVGGTAQLIVNTSWQLGNFKAPRSGDSLSSAVLNVGTIGGGGGSVEVGGPITTTRDPANTDSSSEIHIVNTGSLKARGTVGPLNTLELSNGTLTLDYGAAAPTTTPVCLTTNLNTAPSSRLNVLGTSFPSTGQFPLIQYTSWASGSFSDFSTLTIPGPVGGYISNNVANSSIDLVVTNVLITTWTGRTNGVNTGVWDINATPNWKDQNGTTSTYQQPSATGNPVIFDDSAPGTTTVDLTTSSLAPISLTVANSSLTYTFSGSGRVTGITSLTKNGSGSLRRW